MPSDTSRLIDKIRDAGLAPDAWPEALKSLTAALGVAGAACIIFNRRTEGVDWVCFSGLSTEFQPAYINHYALLDPFSPLLTEPLSWTKLSECLPEAFLRKSEWYNDFVLACGVRDILGTQLLDTPSHSVIFGLHQQIGRSFSDKTALILNNVAGPLASSALQHVEHLFGPALGGSKFYFHVQNGRRYPDKAGGFFFSQREAVAHASVVTAELAQDGGWEGFVIFVTDEDGRVVAQVPVPTRA
jgi:hypothetical protein